MKLRTKRTWLRAAVQAGILFLCLIALVVRLVCTTQFPKVAEASIGDMTSNTENGNLMTFNCGNNQVLVELCTPRTVRVQLSTDGADGYRPYDPEYYMVQKTAWAPVSHTTTDAGDYISVKTSALELRIQKEPFRIGMYDLQGNLISKDTDEVGMYTEGDQVGVRKTENTQNAGGIFGFGSGDHGRRENLNRYDQDFDEFSMSHGRLISPFFMSTVGYGIFLNTIEKDTTFFRRGGGFETTGYLDYFFMYGPDFKTILNEYAEITGRMELYGKWAFGFMLSKYGNDNATQKEFLEWIHRLRDEGYPTDVYVFDYGWRGDVADNGGNQTGAGEKWGSQIWNNDKTKFPDVDAMFAEARELGFHVGLHNNAGTPQAKGGTRLWDEEVAKDWVDSYMAVVEAGRGDWFWPDEFDVLGSNTAPVFAAKGAYEAWIDSDVVDTRPMFITRGSYAGQHFATAWSGDINNTSQELAYQIGFSLDAGLVGYWAVSNDLGGFMGKPTDELYTRWVSEFGAWSAIMRTHGHDGREPWLYDETAQETLKANLKTRYALYPYIYTMAWQGYSQGVPMMRAMILEDGSQYNPDAWDLNKQYYFGDWFLVAPATETYDTVVSVWLPPDTTWYDYNTGERYVGGEDGKTIRVAAALDEIPVFVKAGAIVPMGPDVNYADEKPLDPLTLDIYPAGTSSYTLYEDDGESREYIEKNAYSTTDYRCIEGGSVITFEIGAQNNRNESLYKPADRSYNLKFNHLSDVLNVQLGGSALEACASVEAYNEAQQGYYYDAQSDTLYVKIVDTRQAMTVTVNTADGVTQPALGNENQGMPTQSITDGSTYELENAELAGSVAASSDYQGYTGSGYAAGFAAVGDAVKLDVNIVREGTYDLVLRVNNGKSGIGDNGSRRLNLYLDESVLEELAIKATDWTDSSGNAVWTEYTIEDVELSEGRHTFEIRADRTNAGAFNLDSLTFHRHDTSQDAFSPIQGENAADMDGASVVTDGDVQAVRATANGAWLRFNEVKGENKGGICLRLRSSTGGSIIIYENGVGDKILGTVELPDDGQWQTIEVDCRNTDVSDSNVFFEFRAAEDGALDVSLDWFRFVKKVDAFTEIGAVTADERDPNIVVNADYLGNIYDGRWAMFEGIDFGEQGAKSFVITASSNNPGGTAEVYLDSVSEENLVAEVTVGNTNGWANEREFVAACKNVTGVHNVYIVFRTAEQGKAVCDFYSFRFSETDLLAINETGTLELESGTGVTNDAGNGLRVDTEWSGYTGTGYVAGWKQSGNYVEVDARIAEDGRYTIVLRGAAGKKNDATDNSPRTGALYVDSVKVAEFGLAIQDSWSTWVEYTFDALRLSAGEHTIRIVAEGDNAGNFNLDSLAFTRLTVETALGDAVEEAQALSADDYEAAGWQAMQQILSEARELLASESATQQQIDDVTARLNAAVDALVSVTEEPEEPQTPDPSDPQEPSGEDPSGQTPGGGLDGGAIAGIAIGSVAGAAAIAAGATFIVKRKKNKKQ